MKLVANICKSANSKVSPIVLVHGAWHSNSCWSKTFQPYLAEKGIPSIAFSFRGHGGSDKNFSLKWTRIEEYVHDLKSIVDELDEPPILVGHSMGGFVVQKYLENNPAKAAVLLAPAPRRGILMATLRMFIRHPSIFLRANLRMNPLQLVGTRELTSEYFYDDRVDEAELDEYFSLVENESYWALIEMMYRLPKRPAISPPMLVLGGEKDNVFTQKEIQKTAEFYAASYHMFDNMPHNMMLDKDWKTVADYMLTWISKRNLK